MHPFGFWLVDEFTFRVMKRVVCTVEPLGRGVLDETNDGRVAELSALSGSVARLVEEAGDSFLALLLDKDFIHELSHRSLNGIYDEPLILPHVSKGRSSAQAFAEFCPNFD